MTTADIIKEIKALPSRQASMASSVIHLLKPMLPPIPKRTIEMSVLTQWLKMVLKIAHLSVRSSLAESSRVLITIQTIAFRTFLEDPVL